MSAEEIIELDDSHLVSISSQVTQTIQAGLPLESGLRALAEQTRSRRTRSALVRLSERLEAGVPLATAIEEAGSALPRPMSALVEAGLESGRLDCVMSYCVDQVQRSTSLRQQIWTFLAYPLFLMWFAMNVCGGILLAITPHFKKIFDDFGTQLPDLTIAILQVSDVMLVFGTLPWIIFGLSGPVLLLCVIVFGFTSWSQRWSTSIPILGLCFRYAALNDLCRLLALLVESGLPLPRALRFAGAASDDRWLARKCRMMAADIEDGSPPAKAARLADFPSSLGQVLRNSKSERTFLDAIRALADIYASQCLVNSQLINSIFAPFAVTVALGFAAITAVALFLPLIKLLNDLS